MKTSREAKSAETRERILTAALDLFREKGFGESSMREVAARAGVATGLAYYYFDSKEALVRAFYERTRGDLAALLDAEQKGSRLEVRLEALIGAKFAYFAPNRRFLGALMGAAADPAHPLSPFSPDSAGIREEDIARFARALAETKTTVPKDLSPHLAKILWFYQMGLILFWLYDASDGQARSQRLLRVSARMVAVLIRLSALPLVGPARKAVLELVEIVES